MVGGFGQRNTLKIALVCLWYLPEDWGGVAVSIHALASSLRDLGHEVTVLTSTAQKALRNSEHFEEGIRVVRIKRSEWPWWLQRLPIVGRHATSLRLFLYNVRLATTLKRIEKRLKFDVVEYADVNGEGAFHSWVLESVPYVVRLQTPLFIIEQFYTRFERWSYQYLLGWMEKRAIRKAAMLISPSQSMAKIVADSCGLKVGDVKVIVNPLDPEYLTPLPRLREFNFPENVVLYIGRLEKRKGAFVFAEAIPEIQKAVPNAYFVFAGPDRHSPTGGSTREEIERYLAKSGVDSHQVSFLGQVPRSKLRACYTEATVVAVPTLYEDYPYAVIEPMACGAPVVSSNCYGIPEIINHGVTGLLTKAGDASDLACQIIGLLKNPIRRHQIAEAGKTFIREECSPPRIASLTTQVYHAITGRIKQK